MNLILKMAGVIAWISIGVYSIANIETAVQWEFPELYSVSGFNSNADVRKQIIVDRGLYILALGGPLVLPSVLLLGNAPDVKTSLSLPNKEAIRAGFEAGHSTWAKDPQY